MTPKHDSHGATTHWPGPLRCDGTGRTGSENTKEEAKRDVMTRAVGMAGGEKETDEPRRVARGVAPRRVTRSVCAQWPGQRRTAYRLSEWRGEGDTGSGGGSAVVG